MTDEKHYKLVEDFANDHSMAIGGGIKVVYTAYHTQFIPSTKPSTMKYEDVCFLSEQISGANSFMFWLRRNGYEIRKVKNGNKNKV